MLLTLFVRFSTQPGQRLLISGNIPPLGEGNLHNAVTMEYQDQHHWKIELNVSTYHIKKYKYLRYIYIYTDENGNYLEDWGEKRFIDLTHIQDGTTVLDTWIDIGAIQNNFFTSPFKNIFYPPRKKSFKHRTQPRFLFKVWAPLLKEIESLVIVGSTQCFGNWDVHHAVRMQFDGHAWVAPVDAFLDVSVLEYKYCVVDQNGLHRYENGENRRIRQTNLENRVIIHDGFAQLDDQFKGAGIAIPVFSLRTKKSFGVGEFNDIKTLVDWAAAVSLKMIQILPVNDTTSTHTQADSYPYAAISAFALHPLYISIEAIAGSKYKKAIHKFIAHKNQLNLSEGVCYEEVMNYKLQALHILFDLQGNDIFDQKDFKDFYQKNKSWLQPYAVFSYLRDTFKTADTSQWEDFKLFNQTIIKKFATPGSSSYDKIAFYYFIQFHLHLQLKNAHDYATKKGIVLKGDIAIGVHKHGVDTWIDPTLYHLDFQAGAPPDDFAIKGQNWGFPTYNWEIMRNNQYAWWKQRFEQMSNYFDAFRIDHILGFFRIWSIPEEAVEGIMGIFVPNIPVAKNEILSKGIQFSEQRFCYPYITDPVLWEISAGHEENLKKFLNKMPDGNYIFKDEFNTQKKVEHHFSFLQENDEHAEQKQIIFNLQSNVIFHKDPNHQDQYHFRFNVQQTLSFHHLPSVEQNALKELYNDYFFHRQDELWKKAALEKLPALKKSTDMLICGEDLGMVPKTVPEVMTLLGLLCLEVQRMPKQLNAHFFNPSQASYLSVVTPSTHDMSTLREWWLEDRKTSQLFFNQELWQFGDAPQDASTHIVKSIILQHLVSPAMWSVFQIQDLFAMDESLRLDDPHKERINIPGDPKHYWRYRMPIEIETLQQMNDFNQLLHYLITSSGR